MRAYSIERVPTFIVVDADGSVTRIYEGSSEQLAGIVGTDVMAAARGDEMPEYSLVGNGCAPVTGTSYSGSALPSRTRPRVAGNCSYHSAKRIS
jgi:hypothetical protein